VAELVITEPIMLGRLAAAMAREHVTEGGRRVRGLVDARHPWLYWSMVENVIACERCGSLVYTPSIPQIVGPEAVSVIANYLSPFSREHGACTPTMGRALMTPTGGGSVQ
jgi:hypothetical protein